MVFSIAVSENINIDAPIPLTGNLEDQLRLAASLGFDGVEIHTPTPDQIDTKMVKRVCSELGILITTIGTGSIFGKFNLSISDLDPIRRELLYKLLVEYVDLASELGSKVTIGSLKGNINKKNEKDAFDIVLDELRLISEYALSKGVKILVEATNRYENNYFNTGFSIYEFIRKNNLKNVGILMDVFHMNIEESRPFSCLENIRDLIWHIHIADNNRHYPGDGYFDFQSFAEELYRIGYDGIVSIECLPYPKGEEAGKKSIEFLKKVFPK